MIPTSPGIYPGTTREEYDAIKAMNNSRLSEGMRSMAHLKASMEGRSTKEDSGALSFGRAYHCLVLEPDVFWKSYAPSPAGNNKDGSASASTKEGKAAWAAWNEEHVGKEAVATYEWQTMMAMSECIKAHPAAAKLLAHAHDTEVAVLWNDVETAEPMKCRTDILTHDREMVIDLKTTKCGSASAFEKSIFEYGYHRQAAMTCDGVHAVTQAVYPGFYIIAQEKTRPYLVSVFLIEDEALDYGRFEYTRLLKAYAEAVFNDDWPGYPQRIQPISLPMWARSRARADMEAWYAQE